MLGKVKVGWMETGKHPVECRAFLPNFPLPLPSCKGKVWIFCVFFTCVLTISALLLPVWIRGCELSPQKQPLKKVAKDVTIKSGYNAPLPLFLSLNFYFPAYQLQQKNLFSLESNFISLTREGSDCLNILQNLLVEVRSKRGEAKRGQPNQNKSPKWEFPSNWLRKSKSNMAYYN